MSAHIDSRLGTPTTEEVLEIETVTKLTGPLAERLISSAASEGKTPVDMMADIVERGLRRHTKAVATRDDRRRAASLQRVIDDLRNQIAGMHAKSLGTAGKDRRVQTLQREIDDLHAKLRKAERPPNERALTFALDIEQFLKSEARDRKMTVEMLLRAIIEAVVEDRLFTAVLDQ